MDGVYDKLWDVTVLEYAVSMHTRRGDQSRKKLALEKVSETSFDFHEYVRPHSRYHSKYAGRVAGGQYQQQPGDSG